MLGLKTTLKYWRFTSALILFSMAIFKFALADDIEIDLGSTPTPTKVITNSAASIAPAIVNAPQSSITSNSVPSLIKKVSVNAQKNGTLVSIMGSLSQQPSVEKVSDKKILIKFTNTNMGIPSRLKFSDSIVKAVRSAAHGDDLWMVLDVENVEGWKVGKTDSGYSLLLSSQQNKAETQNNAAVINPTTVVDKDQNSETASSGLFARLIETTVKPLEKGIKLVLTSDQPSKYTFRKLSGPDRLVIRFHATKLEIPEKIKTYSEKDPEFIKGGLLSMETRQIGPQFSPMAEVILTLAPGTMNEIDRDLNQVVVTLASAAPQEKQVERKGDLNQLVSMDIQTADINAVLRTLCSEAGFDVDFVAGPLTGLVNEKFQNIPLKTALSNLLSTGGYSYEVQGNRLRIAATSALRSSKVNMPKVTELISPSGGMTPAQLDNLVRQILDPNNASISVFDTVRNVIVLNGTVSDVDEYKRTIKELKLGSDSMSDRITKVVKLNYSDPGVVQGILSAYLTPVGKVQIEPRTTSLIIWETASNMGVLLELIKELDVKSPQVLIESNIVEVDKENDLDIGFNWNLSKTTGDPTLSGSLSNTLQNTAASPAALSFGTVKGDVDISGALSALESHKLGKIISRPRVATASGVAAEIDSVENVIYITNQQTVGLGGVVTNNVVYNTLALPVDLKITPRITDDGRITTSVVASVTSETGPPAGSGEPPPTSQQTATTTVTIKNGQTIVIGGLVRDTISDAYNGVPLLMNLPLIGDLFQEKELQHQKVELVIFVTPTIIQD